MIIQKDILYVDMDGVIANFEELVNKMTDHHFTIEDEEERWHWITEYCVKSNFSFFDIKPIPDSIPYVKLLMQVSKLDVYFLSSPMWDLPQSYIDKRLWIEKYFGAEAEKKLILTSRKDLNIGKYLVDDHLINGSENFTGEHIHFGTKDFPNWNRVYNYIMEKEGLKTI